MEKDRQTKLLQQHAEQAARESEDQELDLTGLKECNLLPKVDVEQDPYEPQKIVQMKTKPRLTKNLNEEETARTPWLFKKSAFRLYKPDMKQRLDKCFDCDWSFIESKVEYLIKDQKDREQSRKFLKANYKVLRDAYKLTAGQSSEGHSIMSITLNFFSVLMQSCSDFVDNKTLKISDLDLGFIAVKAADMTVQSKLVPMKELIRYNFLEVQIRLAQQKYIKSGLFTTYHEALKSMLSTYIIPQFKSTDSHIWRKTVLW